MIKVDIKGFITDRVWFGWWYRDLKSDSLEEGDGNFSMRKYWSTKWVRDPNTRSHWTIKMVGEIYSD